MKIKLYVLLAILVGSAFFTSCRRESRDPLWNVDVLAPLMEASLSMNNIVRDTGVVKKNPDKSLTLVNRQELAKITLDSLVTLTTTPFLKTAKLSSLVLDTKVDTVTISVAKIIQDLENDGQTVEADGLRYFIDNNMTINSTMLPSFNLSGQAIDISSFFEEADIATGTMNIRVLNHFPVPIQTIQFDIKNSAPPSASIVTHTFNNIPAITGDVSVDQDLAGKHVEGQLKADIPSFDFTDGVDFEPEYDQSIDIILTISNVTVTDAVAIFPEQDVFQNTEDIILTGLTNGVELTEATIASGKLKVEVHSSTEQDLYFTYSIPGATKGGSPFIVHEKLSAAPPNGTSDTVIYYNMDGYNMDLRGASGTDVNTINNSLTGRIKNTGQKVHISLSDSVSIIVTTVDLVPTYVKGYLGQQTLDLGPSTTSLDIFKSVESGSLNFEDVKLHLGIDNGFGIDGSVQINNITARNTKPGSTASATLTGPNVGTPLTINRATDNPYTNTITNFDMSNSATSLINIMPDKIDYSAQVKTNPAGNTGSYSDFAYDNGSLSAFLDIEMPLSIIASQLVLSDTVDFNIAASVKKKNVESGSFNIHVNNGFPLSAALKMYFLDAGGTVVATLKSSNGAILPAHVNGAGVVKDKKASVIKFEVDKDKMSQLYGSYKVIFKIEFTTEPNASYLKIYNTYSIDFKVVGDMDYGLHKK